MAAYTGTDGTIAVNGTAGADDGDHIAQLRSFSVEESADTIEASVMGTSGERVFVSSLTSFSGSADVYWDTADTTGQGVLTVGTEALIKFYPSGDAAAVVGPPAVAADTYYEGNIIVTGVSVSSSFDGMVEASITFQGVGDLAVHTVGD